MKIGGSQNIDSAVLSFDALPASDWALLPESVRSLVAVIGSRAAFAFVVKHGGTSITIPKGKTAQGLALLAELETVVGAEAAALLVRHCADGKPLYVPRCQDLIDSVLKQAILTDYAALMTLARPPSKNAAVSLLARNYQASDRTIRVLLLEPVSPPPVTLSLFAEATA